jgi:hypothetical protein
LGTAAFTLVSWLEISTRSTTKPVADRGLGGAVSVMIWMVAGALVVGRPVLVATFGAWTGLVAVATAFWRFSELHIYRSKLDGSDLELSNRGADSGRCLPSLALRARKAIAFGKVMLGGFAAAGYVAVVLWLNPISGWLLAGQAHFFRPGLAVPLRPPFP